jgi:hypothetical protein
MEERLPVVISVPLTSGKVKVRVVAAEIDAALNTAILVFVVELKIEKTLSAKFVWAEVGVDHIGTPLLRVSTCPFVPGFSHVVEPTAPATEPIYNSPPCSPSVPGNRIVLFVTVAGAPSVTWLPAVFCNNSFLVLVCALASEERQKIRMHRNIAFSISTFRLIAQRKQYQPYTHCAACSS